MQPKHTMKIHNKRKPFKQHAKILMQTIAFLKYYSRARRSYIPKNEMQYLAVYTLRRKNFNKTKSRGIANSSNIDACDDRTKS